MDVVFDKSFSKSLNRIKSKILKRKIKEIIVELEKASTIDEIKNLRKMVGFKSFYRLRIGNYRIGIELEKNNILRLIIIAHRKDIYRVFP